MNGLQIVDFLDDIGMMNNNLDNISRAMEINNRIQILDRLLRNGNISKEYCEKKLWDMLNLIDSCKNEES